MDIIQGVIPRWKKSFLSGNLNKTEKLFAKVCVKKGNILVGDLRGGGDKGSVWGIFAWFATRLKGQKNCVDLWLWAIFWSLQYLLIKSIQSNLQN